MHTIVNVENAHDDAKGNRFLIELVLEDAAKLNKIRRLSIYVFRPLNLNKLCYPKNFQWKKDAMVHLILTGNSYRYFSPSNRCFTLECLCIYIFITLQLSSKTKGAQKENAFAGIKNIKNNCKIILT